MDVITPTVTVVVATHDPSIAVTVYVPASNPPADGPELVTIDGPVHEYITLDVTAVAGATEAVPSEHVGQLASVTVALEMLNSVQVFVTVSVSICIQPTESVTITV